MTMFGSDYSAYQDAAFPDYADDSAVVIKATQGTGYTSATYHDQVAAARRSGLLIGHYHYAGGTNAAAEAAYFMQALAGFWQPGDILVLDWEDGQNSVGGSGPAAAQWIDTFGQTVFDDMGVDVVLYCNLSAARGLAGRALEAKYPLWLAQYWEPASRDRAHADPGGSWNVFGWQWTSSPIDRDVWYVNPDGWAAQGGAASGHTVAPVAQTPPTPTQDTAPAFPLPQGWYFGPKSGPTESVSGYYGHQADLAVWQGRMAARGWSITADGLYGPQTESIARAFQTEKGLTVDGLIGPQTWAAAWTEPVT